MVSAADMDRIAAVLAAELGKHGHRCAAAPRSLTLADALALAASAEALARRMRVPVCICVADAQGRQLLFHRMEGSLPASAGLATGKAWTAAAYRMGSDELGQLAQPHGALFGVGETGRGPDGGQVVLFGGGIPCRAGGVVIGAIGISGGTVDEDMRIARHALDEFFETSGTLPEKGTAS